MGSVSAPVVSVIVLQVSWLKSIVVLLCASSIAWRRLPGPLSAQLVMDKFAPIGVGPASVRRMACAAARVRGWRCRNGGDIRERGAGECESETACKHAADGEGAIGRRMRFLGRSS